jgi:hypothetical protein
LRWREPESKPWMRKRKPVSNTFTTTDGTKVTLPLPHLSNSQVEMYIRCPRQYYYRYIEGLKEAPGFSLAQGLSGHAALELNNLTKIKSGEDLPTKEVIERMSDEWTERYKDAAGEMVLVDPADKKLRKATPKDVDASRRDLGHRLSIYMEDNAPSIQPEGAEERHEVEIAGIPLLAFTDLRVANGVWDYKFGNSRSTSYAKRPAVDKSLQLSLYSEITGLDRVGYYVFLPEQQLKTKKHEAEVLKMGAIRTDAHRQYASYIVQEVAKATGCVSPTTAASITDARAACWTASCRWSARPRCGRSTCKSRRPRSPRPRRRSSFPRGRIVGKARTIESMIPAASSNSQPAPAGEGAHITPLVAADLELRSSEGQKKYGTKLRGHNGRDALVDAYQEALDLCQYLRQAIYERDGR